MMLKKRHTFFLLLLSEFCCAQSVGFEKANFPGRKDELREAIKKMDIGTELFNQGRKEWEDLKRYYVGEHKYLPVSLHDYQQAGFQNFRNALAPLSDAYRFNPKNAELNYMLGFVWFTIDPRGKETAGILQSAYDLRTDATSDVSYWLAWTYHLNSRWDEAIKYYELYQKTLSEKSRANLPALEDVKKKIGECQVGKKLSADPERVFVDNL